MAYAIDVSSNNEVTIRVPADLFTGKFDDNGQIIADKPWSCLLKLIYIAIPGAMEISNVIKTNREGKFIIITIIIIITVNHMDGCDVRFKVDGQFEKDSFTLKFPFVSGCTEICQNQRLLNFFFCCRLRNAIKEHYFTFDDDDWRCA